MIHDLTANSDFHKGRLSILHRIDTELETESDNLASPYNEVVLTGTAFEREHKRYILDYESGHKNICDCCGAPIGNKPWEFETNKTLCPDCEKWLEESHNSINDGELLETVVDDNFFTIVIKPWDIRDFEPQNLIDNVLLWD